MRRLDGPLAKRADEGEEETVWDAYQRKKKVKKVCSLFLPWRHSTCRRALTSVRKSQAKLRKGSGANQGVGDDEGGEQPDALDLGFDDPFFLQAAGAKPAKVCTVGIELCVFKLTGFPQV